MYRNVPERIGTYRNIGTLAAGEHSFPFQFLIPVAVPTSFEGPFGKIVYRVRAAIDTPRFSKDHKALRPFYLLNLLNLNEVPAIDKVTYKTKRPVFDLRTIAEVEGAGVKAGKHAEWREQIIVPPLPQSELAGCSLIDISYFIQVSLKSPDAVVTLPICIGNIAVNMSPSRPRLTAPMGAEGVTPSAPPAEEGEEPEEGMCAGGVASEEIPTKSHSQQDPFGQPVSMSPGAALPPGHGRPDASAPMFCVSTGATIPFFTEGNVTPIPTSCSLILPPEYSSCDYPHGRVRLNITVPKKKCSVPIILFRLPVSVSVVFIIIIIIIIIIILSSSTRDVSMLDV
ncbi:Arrestin domain-containing protein 1 [Liparis tanakae]|uniref:Arrestin domain-containing protein 1 n=1 Tax=Liparis tanakae TaxID=230148 RepID=A0A4Z2FM70_9TELE|nr:Arrestin domain-containing protein 1 [Liparis tanakae]